MTEKQIIIFDGFCNLCSWSVQFVISRDSKNIFKFIPLQSEDGKNLLKKFNVDMPQGESIILITNSRAYVKSEAILEILNILGGIWSFAAIFRIVPSNILDRIYDIIAKYRYRIFGKRKECFIPKSYFNNSQT